MVLCMVGFDAVITAYFGEHLTRNVQKYIKDNLRGIQEVGTSIIFDIPRSDIKLIHTPTMIVPSKVKDENIVYKCTLNTLELAYKNNINSIVLPAFLGGTGGVSFKTIALLMKKAIQDFNINHK